jgi:tRNA-specific 2-thiouridylase
LGHKILARLRNTAPAEPAEITGWDAVTGTATLRLNAPQFGIAAGQAAAIYDAAEPDWLLGGGWISAAPTRAHQQAG